jgi:hypothetical protein
MVDQHSITCLDIKMVILGRLMEEIERSINQAEQDAMQASDEAMRLMVEFGDDSLLMGFVGEANQFKLEARSLRARSKAISQQVQSLERNVSSQFLEVEVKDFVTRTGRLKEVVLEISRND